LFARFAPGGVVAAAWRDREVGLGQPQAAQVGRSKPLQSPAAANGPTGIKARRPIGLKSRKRGDFAPHLERSCRTLLTRRLQRCECRRDRASAQEIWPHWCKLTAIDRGGDDVCAIVRRRRSPAIRRTVRGSSDAPHRCNRAVLCTRPNERSRPYNYQTFSEYLFARFALGGRCGGVA